MRTSRRQPSMRCVISVGQIRNFPGVSSPNIHEVGVKATIPTGDESKEPADSSDWQSSVGGGALDAGGLGRTACLFHSSGGAGSAAAAGVGSWIVSGRPRISE